MEIIETPIKDLIIIKPRVFADSRGYFYETYNAERYREAGIKQDFVQDNLSKSSYGVVRGLHFQKNPHAQAKMVSVVVGAVWDVAVDLRAGSATFGQWYGVELTAENHLQFLIPQGFAHGFSVLSEEAIFTYKCDNLYAPGCEGGVRFDDPALNIDWRIDREKAIVSDKDLVLPLLADLDYTF